MPFCPNCGTAVEGRFCGKCGTSMDAGAPASVQPAVAGGGMADNVASTVCYVLGFITGILFLVLEPYNKNRAVRFHAFQSIFLSVAWFAFWIVLQVLFGILFAVSYRLTLILAPISMLISLAVFVAWIYLLIKTYQGNKIVLPIIGPLAEKQA
jgi:uncharacterized membrane protein